MDAGNCLALHGITLAPLGITMALFGTILVLCGTTWTFFGTTWTCFGITLHRPQHIHYEDSIQQQINTSNTDSFKQRTNSPSGSVCVRKHSQALSSTKNNYQINFHKQLPFYRQSAGLRRTRYITNHPTTAIKCLVGPVNMDMIVKCQRLMSGDHTPMFTDETPIN